MAKRLFVGIAVQEPEDMTPLPGVWSAIKRVSRYVNAASRHDDPILITDEDGPVTVQRVKDALPKTVLLERPRITVYFCGHGAFIDGTEVWYLSQGRKNNRNNGEEQINVMAFRDVLATYGPGQISFFSDACQTVDTMSGAARQVLSPHESAFVQPQYDVFRATIRGAAAYASKTEGPLFSQAISKALSMPPPKEAMGAISGAKPGVFGVSSQSLAVYMYLNMPDYVAVEGVKQQPELLPAIFLDNDYLIYSERKAGAAAAPEADPDDDLGWNLEATPMDRLGPPDPFLEKSAPAVPRSPLAQMARGDEQAVIDTVESISSEWRGAFWGRALSNAQDRNGQLVLEAYLFGEVTAETVQNGLHLPDGKVLTGHATTHDRLTYDLYQTDRVRAGVLNVDDIYIPVPLSVSDILSLVSNIRLPFAGEEKKRSDGVHLLGWYMMYNPGHQNRINPWQVLQGLLTGTITATAIPTLAKDLRFTKHSDPIFGIVAAYLYDRVGDVNGIRRLCAYYGHYGQAIPFDIALLARLPFERGYGGGYVLNLPDIPEDVAAKAVDLPKFVWNAMEGSRVTVSGVVPVLTAGWGRLASLSRDPKITQFADFRAHLQDTPIACLRGHDRGAALIEMMSTAY